MKGVVKRLVSMLVLMCMVLGGTISSKALSTVSTVSIRVEDNGDNKFPTITADDTTRYKLKEAVKWSKEEANLVAGESVTATVIVIPEAGYEIRLADGRNSVKLTGSKGASISGYSRNGSEHTIKIKWVVNGTLPAPANVYWDDSNPWLAKWDNVTNANSYQVQLYRDNVRIASYEVKSRSYDFTTELASSKCADKEGVYFRVKAMSNERKIDDSEWVESEDVWDWTEIWYRAKQKGIAWNGTYHDDYWDDDYWNDNNYNPNGPTSGLKPTWSTRNGWSGSPGFWQYYQNGNLVKNNWVSDSGHWYWMDGTGRMVTGWFHHSDGRWYYMTPVVGGPEGACVKGWTTINGKWYYFYPVYGVNNGYYYKESEMAVSTWIDNFYVGPDGAWTGQTK